MDFSHDLRGNDRGVSSDRAIEGIEQRRLPPVAGGVAGAGDDGDSMSVRAASTFFFSQREETGAERVLLLPLGAEKARGSNCLPGLAQYFVSVANCTSN